MRYSPRPIGSGDDSGTSTDVPDVFSDGAADDSSESASEPDSGGDNSDDFDDDSILDDEEEERELSALHYLQEAEYKTRDYWDRFCFEGKHNPVERFRWLSGSEETVRFLKAFFSWRCGRRRSKKGRRTPGIKYKSSLETFWKWWHLVYKAEVGQGLSKDTIVKILDVLAIVAQEKNLLLGRRPKATMYIEDVAEFARVLLSTTEMTFQSGWLRIQLLLFCQLAAITGSRPGALLNLRYRNLLLTLVRNPDGGRPRLFIYLTPEFTKTFLGEKEQNTFPIPEIVFDPTLVLSPHVFLLGMLFRTRAFKNFSTDGLVVDCPENLYNLGVLEGLGQQELKLKDEILDNLCSVMQCAKRMGFESPWRSNSRKEHYNIAIVRRLPAQKQLMRFAASMSRSIDPRRPYKLEDTSVVNKVLCMRDLQQRVCERKQLRDEKKRAFGIAERAFQQNFGDYLQRKKVKKELQRPARQALNGVGRLEKSTSARPKVRENLERYKNEQPVIDSERQRAGKVVDEEVMGALERTGYMTPQHMILIDTILTMPGSTVEKEYRRRISAINAVIAFCDVEEGSPTRRPNITQKRRALDVLPSA
ncbi:hypothetical protein CNMCM6106_004230 [Aspergillus hiratsukae]|uniref:Uncharacterized protein n=1 Tax=Aspergillus hiratsukae TaxID=1194566 RepID=A0A8H6QAG6_9EURO|nr:hypothetical protein CNMCM6106_004230 [Aspergillus hiratsukae]